MGHYLHRPCGYPSMDWNFRVGMDIQGPSLPSMKRPKGLAILVKEKQLSNFHHTQPKSQSLNFCKKQLEILLMEEIRLTTWDISKVGNHGINYLLVQDFFQSTVANSGLSTSEKFVTFLWNLVRVDRK